MSPIKAAGITLLIFAASIPFIAIPDIIFPDSDDSVYYLCSGIGIFILFFSLGVLIYLGHQKQKNDLEIIEIALSSAYKIIAKGTVRKSISLSGILAENYPAILVSSRDAGYQLISLVEKKLSTSNLSEASVFTTYSNIPRDITKYIGLTKSDQTLFFAPQEGYTLLFQGKYADSIANKLCLTDVCEKKFFWDTLSNVIAFSMIASILLYVILEHGYPAVEYSRPYLASLWVMLGSMILVMCCKLATDASATYLLRCGILLGFTMASLFLSSNFIFYDKVNLEYTVINVSQGKGNSVNWDVKTVQGERFSLNVNTSIRTDTPKLDFRKGLWGFYFATKADNRNNDE